MIQDVIEDIGLSAWCKTYSVVRDAKDIVRIHANKLLLRSIRTMNRARDNQLSDKLWELSERYNTRPGETHRHKYNEDC